jgi:phosphoglycolate phosphatase
MPPAPVVFDLDGTLVDSAPDFLSALNRLFDEIGRPRFTLPEVRAMMGYGARVLVEHALERSGGLPAGKSLDELSARVIELFFERHLEFSRLFPGVVTTLTGLRAEGRGLGLCTNKPHEATLETLARLEIARFFDAVVGGGETMKPDADHLKAVIDAFGPHAGSAVMVGDTETDVKAARNAKLPVIVVSYGYSRIPAAELGADRVIDAIAELPRALSELDK